MKGLKSVWALKSENSLELKTPLVNSKEKMMELNYRLVGRTEKKKEPWYLLVEMME